jgi:RNase P subunit RPR2
MKLFFRTFIDNFNIKPIGNDEERPIFYNLMLEGAKTFSKIFETWSKIENEKKIKINEIRKNNKPLKLIDKSFLNNSNLLQSKFIYNLIVEQYLEKRNLKLPPNIENKEQINIFLDINRLNCSNIRLINYKLLRHGLPTNKKFKNRYDNICFMCKKFFIESPEHIFVNLERIL